MSRRRARLRFEYADQYPNNLWAGVWHDALWVTEIVRRRPDRRSGGGSASARILDEEHFEFQGGDFGAGGGMDRRHQP